MSIDVPEQGGPLEPVVELSDDREVHGVQMQHPNVSRNVARTITATPTSITHDVGIGDAHCRRPE